MERSSPEVSQSLGLGPWTRCCSISTDTERFIELNGVTAGAVVFSGAGKRREYVAIMIDVSEIGFSLWTDHLWKIYHRIQVQSQPLYTGGWCENFQ
jgi:hypothetical protein